MLSPAATLWDIGKERHKMYLYIYESDTMLHIATIIGVDNDACERKAGELYGDSDQYGWTYSAAFGSNGGLRSNEDAIDIAA